MSRVRWWVERLAAATLGAALLGGGAAAVRASAMPDSAGAPGPGLAPTEARAPTQVVLHDRATRTSTIISHDEAGRPGTASSSRPSVSADGAAVAFESEAAIVAGDTDETADIYLWTRASDSLERLSVAPDGGAANGASRDPSISGDGGLVAFTSAATNLTADPPATADHVYAWQGLAGLRRVSVTATGGDAGSRAPAVSLDGRVVAFESDAADLVGDDANGAIDIFLTDLTRSATIRASVDSGGAEAADEGRRPSISADGGAVVFDSVAAFDSADANGLRDVYVRDLPPAVLVTPAVIDFGEVALGTQANRSATVTSIGWTPVVVSSSSLSGAAAADFVIADDACAGAVLPFGTSCAIAVVHLPTAAGARTATLSVNDNAQDSPQQVTLLGGVPAPALQLEPPIGRPGVVTTLRGTRFPPGAAVTLRWDRGITQRLAPVVVGPDGTFSVGVLVFHNDQLGPRQLLVGADAAGPSFDATAVSFLVVPPARQPPGTNPLTALDPRVLLVQR